MSIIDKLTGRAKKAAGDLAGDSSLRRQGAKEERKGEKKEELSTAPRIASRRRPRRSETSRGRPSGPGAPGTPAGRTGSSTRLPAPDQEAGSGARP